jgi:hypothetical protein
MSILALSYPRRLMIAGGILAAIVVVGQSAGSPSSPAPARVATATSTKPSILYAEKEAEHIRLEAQAEQTRRENTPEAKAARIAAEAEQARAQARAEAACHQDLSCFADKNWSRALTPCRVAVESLAKNNFRLVDTWTQSKFDRFRWKNQKAGIITYIGDKIEMQNGFGAYLPVSYECDFMAGIETVADARVKQGRLPR